MGDLETLIPQVAELVIGGEPLAIKSLKVGQMSAFLHAITPVMQQVDGSGIDWPALFDEHSGDSLTAVSIIVDKPRAWVDKLATDETILLAAKVIEVSIDFFTRTVMPRPDGLIARTSTTAAVVTDGSTPSST